MKSIEYPALVFLVVTACIMDLREEKIPNWLTVSGVLWGLLYRCIVDRGSGLILSAGGMLLPVLLFGGLYYFRMMGAGDLKLMCAIGSFLGPVECFGCMITAVMIGAVIAVLLIAGRKNLFSRISYFTEYVTEYSRTRTWKAYMPEPGDGGRFCFSVPLLLSVFLYLAGGYI